MKKAIYIVVSIALLAILVIWLALNKRKVEAKVYRFDNQQEVLITIDTVKLKDLSSEKRYPGIFEPNREVKVMADLSGKVIRMNVDLGDYLRTGALVAQLDNELLKLQLEGIQVQIAGYEKDVDRYRILVEAEAIQAIQLEKTELALQSALVQQKTLQEQINRTTIRAPFDGIVTQKFTEVGAVVAMSMPIIQLTDISSLKLNLTIPESDLRDFQVGQQLSVSSDIYPDLFFPGNIVMVGSRGDASHNFLVQIKIVNTRDRLLKAGMFGWVTVNKGHNQSLPTIPVKALFGSSLHQQVYVVEQGKVTIRDIEVDFQNTDFSAVSAGLRPGEIVVTSGFINLKNGSNVKYK